MKKILTFVMFVILFNLSYVHAYEMTYQGASNKTYIVGSGTDEVGVNTGSSNAMGNIQFTFLFKGDIIRYIPDTMNTNVSTAGKTYTLGAGFTFSDNNQDVTPNYARIISTFEGATFGNTGFPIYKEVEITSDYPIVLYTGSSWPTSLGTIHTDENNNSWYYRSQTWSVSPYQVDHNITWNLNDGVIYGETELPDKYYLSEKDYTITLASAPVKKSSHFSGWTFSTNVAKLSQVSPTVIKESAIKFNNNSSQGIVNTLNNTNYDVVVTANFSSGKTLEFNLNGGTLEGISDNYLVEIPNNNTLLGSVINAYTPTKNYSTFVGWYSDSELTQRIYDTTELDCSSSNTEIYAKWEDGLIGISEVEVRGITVPVAGAHPVTTGIEIVTPGLTATWAEWFEDEEGGSALTSADTFKAGKRYYLLFRATPDEGYEYTGDILIYPEDHVTATPEPIRYDHGHDGVEFEFYYETKAAPELVAPKLTASMEENIVTLNWDEQEGTTKAEVYRSENKKKWTKVGTVTTNTYKNTGLTYGKTYYYKVRLYNGTKWTNYSSIISKKPVPNKVENVSVVTAGSNNVKISYDKVNVTGYEVHYSTDNKKWSKATTITKNSTLSYNKTGLKTNTVYYFKVKAYKTVGKTKVYGPWSDVVSTKTAPVKPTLSLSIKEYNEHNVNIGEAKGASKYVVERSTDGKTYALVEELTAKGTLTQTGEMGTTYYYRVKACNQENNCSAWATSSIKQNMKTPTLKVENANDNTLLISGYETQEATSYVVYRATKKTGKYTEVGKTTDTSFVSTGLTYGKTYYYKVKAMNDVCSVTSGVVSGKTIPNKVENVVIKSVGTNNIVTAWDKVNVNGYEVYSSTDNKKWSKATTITKNSTLTYNKTKLSANKVYYFRVRAYKTVSRKKIYGPWSDVVSTKTAPVKPTLSLSIKEYNEHNLNIGESKGASKYVVEKSLDGKEYSLVEELPGKGVLSQAGELGTTYYYRLKACNVENNCSAWVTASIKQTTKIPSLSLSTSSKKVTITVTKVDKADGYEIYRNTKKTGKYTKVATLTSEEEVLEYVNATSKGKTYYYKVRAYSQLDETTKVYSSYSSVKSIRSK